MEKKGSWFYAVKAALCSHPKDKKEKKTHKPKKNCFGKLKKRAPASSSRETALIIPAPPLAIPTSPPVEDVKLTETEHEQNKHAYSVAIATAVAAEAAVAAAQAAAEVVRLTSVTCSSGRLEEVAAIKIQTAFRGYLARRALRALRGLVRLKSLIQGQSVKHQAATTLKYMQTLAHVQLQIRTRRMRMSEENQALQRQLQQKSEKELEKLRNSMAEDWDDSTQSKEQVEAKLQSRQEAAIRREKALAYAFSHQRMLANSSKSANSTFMDPNNPHWGWDWLERWMAARPWESQSTMDHADHASVKSAASRVISVGEITKAYSRHDLSQDNRPSPTGQKSSRPHSRQSTSTPPSMAPSLSSVTGRRKLQSPKGSGWSGDDDMRSLLSVQSDRCRRHSIGGSSMRDDESLTSSPAVPSYMAPTQSAKARSRLPSPLGSEKNGTPEKGSAGSVKKRLSFSASPGGPRRHSSPPGKVHSTPGKDIGAASADNVNNDGSR
ncbi:hypothetical protein I3760_01G273300 [Carya illinoinensis]|nr:hypothetical protein I3760_01G273300 [Carya illinoinensis]KAG2729982.1 hypothetical protein I3760_01G273300 [Carya illinoinensis]KAG2729983.1 hypothetical protein I3760_01G273300 [Carya illinoinensis]